jgi:hypothetical protein
VTVAFRVSSSAAQIPNNDNHLEIEPILDRECPRASFLVTDGDPENMHMNPVVELDLEEIRELRDILERVDKTLAPLWANPED